MALIAAAAACVQEAPDGAGLQAQPAALDAFHLELADVGDDPRGRRIGEGDLGRLIALAELLGGGQDLLGDLGVGDEVV